MVEKLDFPPCERSEVNGVREYKLVLRKVFRAKVDEIRGEWGKFHNAEHALYSSPNIIKAKVSPLEAMKAHVECECKGPHIHNHGTRMR